MSERDKPNDKRPEQADEAVPSPDLEQAVASPVRDVEAEFDLAGEAHRTPSASGNAAQPDETQTYGEITWEQFRKYRLAYASMWAVVGLVLLAIYAPVIASDLPFALTVGETTTYPWLANLFNKNYYENTIDIIFNSLMFLLPLGIALYIPAARVGRRIRKRHAQRLKRRTLTVFALLVVAVDAWLIIDPLPGSSPTGVIIQAGLFFAGLGVVALLYARAMMEALGVAPERLKAMRWIALGAVALVAFGGAALLSGSIKDVADRPETPVLQSMGWYAWDFPLPGENLRRLNETRLDEIRAELDSDSPSASAIAASLEERDFSVAWPPVAFSFRGTSTDIEADMSRIHPLGTDNIGRDVFARMIFGTRIALTIGIVAVGIYITLGVLLGALAGYFGGWVDWLILRFVEIMLCFPSLFLILTLASFVDEPSVFYVMLIIGVTRWTGPARLVRGEFLRLRNQEFVQAAKALGLPEWRIIFKHVLPNALGPVLVSATFGVASAILVESTISFLGMGDPSAPTWGKILNDGRVFRNNIMILMPGFAIFLTVSLFNLMGEGLRDALDPKMRR